MRTRRPVAKVRTRYGISYVLVVLLLILAACAAEILLSGCGAIEKQTAQAAIVAKQLAATQEQMRHAYQCALVAQTCIDALVQGAETAPPAKTIEFIQACSDAWRELQCEALINQLLGEKWMV